MLIADTSPLVAMLNAKDKHHRRAPRCSGGFRSPVIAPTPIITEVAYFLRIEPSPVVEAAFLDAWARGELVVEATTVQDLARMADLVGLYTDSPQRSARSIARPSSCCRPTAGTRQGPRDSRCPGRAEGTGAPSPASHAGALAASQEAQEEHGREHPTTLVPPT
jgi:hypothetical protein